MNDHVINIKKIGQHGEIIKISIGDGVDISKAVKLLLQLIENCFKSGMYKLIIDMAKLQFPSSSFIALLIEITARSRRAGGDVKLINISPSAVTNLVTFNTLNYLSSEEDEASALEDLELFLTENQTPIEERTDFLTDEQVQSIENSIFQKEPEVPPIKPVPPEKDEVEVPDSAPTQEIKFDISKSIDLLADQVLSTEAARLEREKNEKNNLNIAEKEPSVKTDQIPAANSEKIDLNDVKSDIINSESPNEAKSEFSEVAEAETPEEVKTEPTEAADFEFFELSESDSFELTEPEFPELSELEFPESFEEIDAESAEAVATEAPEKTESIFTNKTESEQIEAAEPNNSEPISTNPEEISEPDPNPPESAKKTVDTDFFKLKEPDIPVGDLMYETASFILSKKSSNRQKTPKKRSEIKSESVQTEKKVSPKKPVSPKEVSGPGVQKVPIQQPPKSDAQKKKSPIQKSPKDKKRIDRPASRKVNTSSAQPSSQNSGKQLNIEAESILGYTPERKPPPLKPDVKSTPKRQPVIKKGKLKPSPAGASRVKNKSQKKVAKTAVKGKQPIRPRGYQIRVKSKLESLYTICDFVTKYAGEVGFHTKEIAKIKVTVYEAAINVIEHAYRSAPDEWIVVRVQFDAKKFMIVLQDWGESFQFDDSKTYDVKQAVEDRKTGGFGLFIIKRSMDDVIYKNDPVNGNRLILIKKIKTDP